MLATPNIKKAYTEIQKKLFYMIPEKWNRICLYASIIEGMNKLQTGEMFFYYFPKGILKKDPVNVYEVPNKFNIDETQYFKLADELYGIIKSLRQEYYVENNQCFSNLTITIDNTKFTIEYGYEDLSKSDYSSYERHIIWRYQYLQTGINTYNRKERTIIENYLQNKRFVKEKREIYTEGIYLNPVHNVVDYNKKEEEEENSPQIATKKNTNQIQSKREMSPLGNINPNYKKKKERKETFHEPKPEVKIEEMVKQHLTSVNTEQTNQILHYKRWK